MLTFSKVIVSLQFHLSVNNLFRLDIETIVKFAALEYKMGEPNRGSTIFESILKNYPKRTDIWSIYIDMNIKEGDLEQVR